LGGNAYFCAWDNMTRLHYRYILLLIFVLGTAFNAVAQDMHSIAGFVCTKGTSARLAAVKVLNKRTNSSVITDDIGNFTIKAAIGDSLEFSTYNYTTNKIAIAGIGDLIVYMNKVVQLETVTIQGQTKQQELSSTMGDYAKKGVYYGGKPSVMQDLASPINGIYSMFSRDAKNARHFAEFSKNEMEASEDHKKYNKELVKKITNIPDEDLDRFTFGFKPSHEDLMKMTDYDVITYIKKSYETFKKFGAKPTPELVTPPSQPPVNQ